MSFVEAVKDLAAAVRHAGARGRRLARRTARAAAQQRAEAGHADRRAREGRRGLPQAARRARRAPSTTSRAAACPARSPRVRPRLRARGLAQPGQRVSRLRRPAAGRKRPGHRQGRGRRRASKRYDRFRDRIMFPIRNVKGECIGFGGRVLGDGEAEVPQLARDAGVQQGPRALRPVRGAQRACASAATCWSPRATWTWSRWPSSGFPQRRRHARHGLHRRARAKAVPLHRRGGLQLRRRRRRPARRAQGARRRPAATPPTCARVKFLFLPAEHDPDSYIREFGREAFARYVQRGRAAVALPGRGGARRLRPRHRRGPRPHGRQRQAAVELLPDGALKRQLLARSGGAVQSWRSTNCWHSGAWPSRRPSPTPPRRVASKEPVPQARVRQWHAARH